MTSVHRTTGLSGVAALALGAVMAVSGHDAEAASVTASGVTGGCANGIVTPNINNPGVIDVLAGGSWKATFEDGDARSACFFTLQNTSSSAFAATISVITVDQGGETDTDTGSFTSLYGFENGVGLFSPQLSSQTSGLILGFPEGVGATRTIGFNIARNSSVFFDWVWGTPFGFANGAPTIEFSVTATPVPLPAAGLMLLGGFGGLGGLSALRRRKRAA